MSSSQSDRPVSTSPPPVCVDDYADDLATLQSLNEKAKQGEQKKISSPAKKPDNKQRFEAKEASEDLGSPEEGPAEEENGKKKSSGKKKKRSSSEGPDRTDDKKRDETDEDDDEVWGFQSNSWWWNMFSCALGLPIISLLRTFRSLRAVARKQRNVPGPPKVAGDAAVQARNPAGRLRSPPKKARAARRKPAMS